VRTPDDDFPDDDPAGDGQPDIEDPEWLDNIVDRAVKKAESQPPPSGPATTQTDTTPPPQASQPQTQASPQAPQRETPDSQPQAQTRQPQPQRSQASGRQPIASAGAVTGVETLTGVGELVTDTAEASPDHQPGIRMRQLVEWIAVIVGALLVALLIKTFLIQPFYIPSGSMSPTLNKDDRILVNKLSYDLHDVNRGDIVVFETPQNFPDPEIDNLVKRVIALEGETIDFSDGRVVIDDRFLEEPYIGDGLPSTWTSGLPPGCISETADTSEGCTIPDGHVFVMGDNRTGSDDARVFGPIPEDLIVGRAFLRVWPVGEIGFL
jgi:signal peptidase I